ncbi:signal peptidase I [Candidatus Woesearchaeota archaeon]|nr:MAG: signal peptidase I [Candidatus Woesearchaeota archaeon]
MALKATLKKIWHFIWNEDSIWSWIVNLILAFIIIKYLIYPGLGLALGTQAPIVAVVSGSMEHDTPFEEWWNGDSCCTPDCSKTMNQGEYYNKRNLTKAQFAHFPFKYGFDKGDIMFLHKRTKIKIGDVIVYRIKERKDPIIHRVINIIEEHGKRYYSTKGDHNCGVARFERVIPEDNVIGKASIRMPFLGWIKIAFVKLVSIFA